MMRMLLMIDLRDYASFKEYDRKLENNDYDVEIVRKYCAMIAEGEQGNKGNSNEAFKQLVSIRDIKDKKGRRNKGAFYFNWEVVIPYHHDLWTNFQTDTKEILVLWYMRKNRLQYKFKPFIWEVGGHFTFPDDKDKIEYHHFRGFDDVFTEDINLPFPSFL